MGVDSALGRANVAIRATLEKLDGDLAGARSKVDGAVQKIASGAVKNLQTIGTGVLGGIGAATGAVVGLGAALAKITVDAAPVEGLADSFEGLAESAGYGADEMLAALQRGSSGMISQRDLMMSFNKAASLVSTDFAVQLPDAMQYLNKVAAATGQDVGFLMDSLVTGVGRLSPMILDNLSIQVSLAEATAEAAKMYGVEESALTKAQVQAGMMAVTLEKLEANTAAMPDVTESATAKLAQLRAGFQDTKDRIGMAFLPTLTTVLGVISDLAGRVLPPLTNFLEGTLAPAFEKVAGVVQDFIWMLDSGVDPLNALHIALSMLFGPETAGLVGAIRDAIKGLADEGLFVGIENFLRALNIEPPAALWDVLNWLITTKDAVTAWLAENVKLQDVLVVLGAAIASVVLPALWGIVTAAAPVIAVFVAGVAIVAALRAAWENDFLGIRTALTDAWEGTIKPALTELWTWLKTNVPLALEALRSFWVDSAWPAIQAVVQAVWPVVQAIFQAIGAFITGTVIPTVQNLYNTWVTVVWPAIQNAIQTVWPIVESIFQTLVAWVTGTLIPTIQTLYDKWVTEVWPAIQTALENAWTVISAVWEELGRWINDNIVPWIELLKKVWSETVWPAIQTALETAWGVIEPIWEALRAWLEETLPPALEGLQGVFETIMGAIQSAIQPVKDLWDAFAGAVSKFWDWISNREFNFKIKLPDLPDWAVPGSPLPIHTAWAAFAQELNRVTIAPRVDVGHVEALLPTPQGRQDVVSEQRQVNIQVAPHYYRGEEPSLTEELRLISMAWGNA